jgi:hypothetical protein
MFDMGHALAPDVSAKYLATRNPVMTKYTTNEQGDRQYQFMRCCVCGKGCWDREAISKEQIKAFFKDHDTDECSARFDSVRYIFDPKGFEPVQKRVRKPKVQSEDPQPVETDTAKPDITWTVARLMDAYPGLITIEEDDEPDSDDDEEEQIRKEQRNERNAMLREGTLSDETIRYMFDAMMATKKTMERVLKTRAKPTSSSSVDPRYAEATATISKLEAEKRMLEEQRERMEQRIKELEQSVQYEIQQREKAEKIMEEAMDEYGMKDTLTERAKEIARIFQ